MEKAPILQWIKKDEIRIPEKRLRSRFSDSKAKLFSSSIEKHGVLQPIVVVEDDEGNKWLVDGQNRLEEHSKRHSVVPAIIKRGTKVDAIIDSAKYNILRGKVNPGELSEFISYIHKNLGLSYEKISQELNLSKGYISKLVQIAENTELLEKVKNGELSLKEAYNRLLGFTVKPISSEKAPFADNVQKKGSLEEPKKEEVSSKEGLEDEDLGVTNLKEELEEGKRSIPMMPEMEKEKEQEADVRHLKCLVCGLGFRLGEKPAWIPVHRHEKSLAFDILEKARAEREGHQGSPQP